MVAKRGLVFANSAAAVAAAAICKLSLLATAATPCPPPARGEMSKEKREEGKLQSHGMSFNKDSG